MTRFESDLIFDLGMHKALDSEFYLKKGFNVVAVEAVKWFCDRAAERLGNYVKSGRLTIVQKAIYRTSNERLSFFVNKDKDDWGSIHRYWAEKGGHKVTEVEVVSVSLDDLFETYGVPYYMKCDVEGVDELVIESLLSSKHLRPRFASVEGGSFEMFGKLAGCGYNRFQIVNQALHPSVQPPHPPREGDYVSTQFTGHMSGLFGFELPLDRWRPFKETFESFVAWRRLCEEDIVRGWCDIHATKAATLEERGVL